MCWHVYILHKNRTQSANATKLGETTRSFTNCKFLTQLQSDRRAVEVVALKTVTIPLPQGLSCTVLQKLTAFLY